MTGFHHLALSRARRITPYQRVRSTLITRLDLCVIQTFLNHGIVYQHSAKAAAAVEYRALSRHPVWENLESKLTRAYFLLDIRSSLSVPNNLGSLKPWTTESLELDITGQRFAAVDAATQFLSERRIRDRPTVGCTRLALGCGEDGEGLPVMGDAVIHLDYRMWCRLQGWFSVKHCPPLPAHSDTHREQPVDLSGVSAGDYKTLDREATQYHHTITSICGRQLVLKRVFVYSGQVVIQWAVERMTPLAITGNRALNAKSREQLRTRVVWVDCRTLFLLWQGGFPEGQLIIRGFILEDHPAHFERQSNISNQMVKGERLSGRRLWHVTALPTGPPSPP
ncbi:hypothetical protein RRG08_058845 [Elysia crispata]|uniref:Uncharacterized protein n=1 Tax=Elysia crispata TaxID=231223 RepID=A0AAE1CQ64_9GAST|nr:hypothetical protein RRG08_058845 [Elysia crispata]